MDILAVKCCIKSRINCKKSDLKTFGYKAEKRYLRELLQRCVAFGESESILLIGSRGSGKNTLLNDVLEQIQSNDRLHSVQVYLNGFFVHDDKSVLHEIARQLELGTELSLRNFFSFQEGLQYLLSSGSSGLKKGSIFFILDEFDAFLQSKNHSLLYNIFEAMHNYQPSMCVIGLTSRVDVTELFEKRVKSRFSHRQIHLCMNMTFNEYKEVFVDFLSLSGTTIPKEISDIWNAHIQLLSEDSTLNEILKKQFQFDNSLSALKMFLLYPVSRLTKLQPSLTTKDFILSYKALHATNSKSVMLQGLSVLELSIVVAAANIQARYYGEAFNFEMVFNEYKNFCERKLFNHAQEKAIVFKAFENLCMLEFLYPVESTSEKIRKDYWLMDSSIHLSELNEAVAKAPNCPTQIKQWMASEFVAMN